RLRAAEGRELFPQLLGRGVRHDLLAEWCRRCAGVFLREGSRSRLRAYPSRTTEMNRGGEPADDTPLLLGVTKADRRSGPTPIPSARIDGETIRRPVSLPCK